MDKITLEIPKKSEYVSVTRLTTSSISNIKQFNIDDIEDLRVIISEICVFFINNIENNEKPLKIKYNIFEDKLNVIVRDLNDGILSEEAQKNSKMCMLIIESLADTYDINYKEKEIIFTKNSV